MRPTKQASDEAPKHSPLWPLPRGGGRAGSLCLEEMLSFIHKKWAVLHLREVLLLALDSTLPVHRGKCCIELSTEARESLLSGPWS